MMLIAHESMEQARESAVILVRLGSPARKLLAEAVEATGVKRKQLSKAAKDLETAGFLFVRESGNLWESQFELMPTLAGEEALEVLDEQ
ncbi:hypothetical protein [Janthinobacterium sp. UMAB-56]|jgi:DNA-binding MarR family transcriptional regulator|uniref:hypothetical protein n=1 Tax=Janthinobacterium sp. UMAB-56 TaxID=1365361 RepID=UPI001C55FC0D|nr:hypothetical protein [Janthinobacterium sp. UMAB-56]